VTGAGFLLPFGCRHWLLGHPVPPGDSAPLTIGLPRPPAGGADPSGVSMFRTRETQLGPGSGSGSALLRPRPLRTGQARFPGISAQASPKAHGQAEGPFPCA
jgi:hypothetical protein